MESGDKECCSDTLETELASASSYCRKMFSSSYSHIYRCPYCNKMCPFKSRLEIHMRTHTGEKPFRCDICKKEFSDSSNFQVHLRCHSGAKTYKCNMCTKAYFRPNSLIRHETIKHGRTPGRKKRTGVSVKKFEDTSDSPNGTQCTYCDKICTNAVTLKRHIRMHTGEKPFQCNICQKEFADNSNYHRHMRAHSGERKFKCCVCSKAFCRKDVLIRHEIEMHGRHPPRKRDKDIF